MNSFFLRFLTVFGMTDILKLGKVPAALPPFFSSPFFHEISCHSKRSEEPRRARRRQSFSPATI